MHKTLHLLDQVVVVEIEPLEIDQLQQRLGHEFELIVRQIDAFQRWCTVEIIRRQRTQSIAPH